MAEETIKRTFTVVLTDAEIAEREKQAVKLWGDLEHAKLEEKNAESNKRRAVAEMPETHALNEIRGKCEHIEEEARRIGRIAREAKEERQIECFWRHEGKRDVLVRSDNDEVIDSRPHKMKQQPLPGTEPPAPAASDDGTNPPWADGKGSGGAPN